MKWLMSSAGVLTGLIARLIPFSGWKPPCLGLLIGSTILLLCTVCGVVSLDRFIFFPDARVPPPPPGVEERWITTRDGVRIHAWYSGAPDAYATLLWSHGNGGNIANRQDVLLALASRRLNVLAYDYRGYGKSGGQPSEAGVYRDAEAAFDDEQTRGTEPSQIICFGESLGGAVSIKLATRRACAGVAVVSTFTRMRDVGRRHYGPLAELAGDRFNSLSRLASLRVPIFIAHGDRDEIVPFELGEQLYAAAPEPKRFLRVRGAHHNDILDDAQLLDAIADFARQATSGELRARRGERAK